MNKENSSLEADELRSEYDFSKLSDAVRGKYAEKYRAGTNLVHLDPDVAAVFQSDEAVNDTLRSLIQLAKSKIVIYSNSEKQD